MQALGVPGPGHRFIPGCAHILHPLNDLISSKESIKTVQWNDKALTAFVAIKEAFANATLLSHLKSDAPNIVTDASDVAVGAVLLQYINHCWYPIAYFSKKLQPAQTRYSTFD